MGRGFAGRGGGVGRSAVQEVSKGSGRRPASVTDAVLSANWVRTFSKGVRMKVYHYHLFVHEAVHAETELEAQTALRDRWPFDADRFELMDVQDAPESANE